MFVLLFQEQGNSGNQFGAGLKRARRFPELPADGLLARLVLSILESAGILYANLSPPIVTGLARLPSFTPEPAGYVFSADMAGTAADGLIAVFLLANVGFGLFFGISFPYLMGVAAELDNSGQMGSLAAFAGNLGLAMGPMVAGFLAGGGRYEHVLVVAALAIAIAGVLIAGPARMLDNRNRTGKVIW